MLFMNLSSVQKKVPCYLAKYIILSAEACKMVVT